MKKQVLSLFAILSVLMPLSSCSDRRIPTAGGETVDTGNVSTTPPDTDTPIDDPNNPFASEILRNGYAVSSTLPTTKSNLTKEQVVSFLNNVLANNSSSNPAYTETVISFFSQEEFLEILRTGGVTKEFLSKIEDTIKKTDFAGAIQKLSQENYEKGSVSKETVREAVRCYTPFLEIGTEDQFAACFSLLMEEGIGPYTTFASSNNGFAFGMYGLYTIAINVFPLMTGNVKTFFDNLFKDSNIDMDSLTLSGMAYSCFATPELSFFMGRFVYKLFKSSLSTLGEDNFSEMIQLSLNWLNRFDTFDSVQSARLGNLLGRVLEDCFMDYSSFQEFARLFANSLSDLPKRIQTEFVRFYPGQILAFTEDYKEAADKIAKDGKGYFATIKFLANVLKNMDAEDYDSAYHFFETMFRSYDYETTDFSTDIIRFSKVLTEAFTNFPQDKDAIMDGIARSGDLFMAVLTFAPSFKVQPAYDYGSYGSIFYKDFFPQIDMDALVELLQDSASLDPDNASQTDRDRINSVIANVAKDMEENYSQTSYELFAKPYFKVGEKPSFQIQSSDSSKLVDIPEKDIEGFDSSSPRSGIATFVYDGVTFACSYLVSDSTNIVNAYCEGDVWNSLVALGTEKDEMPDVYCYTSDGQKQLVDKDLLVDYDASTVGAHYAYIQVGEEYVIFSYEVYDPKTTSFVFDFGKHYKGEYESQRFSGSLTYEKEGKEAQLLTNNASVTTRLDFSTPGKMEKRMDIKTSDGRLVENALVRYEVEDTTSASTSVHCELDRNLSFYQGTNDYLDVEGKDFAVSDYGTRFQTDFTLKDGTKKTISYYPYDNTYFDSTRLMTLHFKKEAFDTTEAGEKTAFAIETIPVSAFDTLGNKVGKQDMPISVNYEVTAGTFDYRYVFDEEEYVFDEDGNPEKGYANATITVTFTNTDDNYGSINDKFYESVDLDEISQAEDFDLTPGSHSYTIYVEWSYYYEGTTYSLPLTLHYAVK